MNALTPKQLEAAIDQGCFQATAKTQTDLWNPITASFAMGATYMDFCKQTMSQTFAEIDSLAFFAEKGQQMFLRNLGFGKLNL